MSSHRASIVRVIFRACSALRLQTQSSPGTLCPSARKPRQGRVGGLGSQRESVWDGGKERSGEGWPGGGGRASVVLKEGQEVVVTIARQVRGVQVREELVGVCEFWQEIQRRLRHVGCSLRSGLTL